MEPNQVSGDIIELAVTNKSHFGNKKKVGKKPDNFISEFNNALKDAFYNVNDIQLKSDDLTTKLAVNPNSVDIHDVTIAAEKARLSLQFTKSIVDRVVQAYKELINMR